MPVLYTILGIVLFFVIVFLIPLSVIVDYGEKVLITVKWLFLKIPVYDSSKEKSEDKPKKEKKAKKSKSKGKTELETVDETTVKEPADEPKVEASAEEVPDKANKKQKNKGNGLLKQLYLDQGYDGIEKMFRALGKSLGGFFGKLYKTFTIDELYITMITAGSDAADTAIKHGKLCSWLYPVLGKLVSTCKVKKYDFDISPDFLAQKSTASVYARVHLIPLKVTNAAVVLAVQLVFKVLFKILFAKKKSDKSKKDAAVANETQGIATDAQAVNKDKEGVSQ